MDRRANAGRRGTEAQAGSLLDAQRDGIPSSVILITLLYAELGDLIVVLTAGPTVPNRLVPPGSRPAIQGQLGSATRRLWPEKKSWSR